MEYRVLGDTVALRLDQGEELCAAVEAVCRRETITLGTVTGLGACDHVVVGVYNVAEQHFYPNTLDGPLEITSLTGNVTSLDGGPYLHLHASFGDAEGHAWGGHLKVACISATAEIFIRRLDGRIGRKKDPVTGLNVFDFGGGPDTAT